MRPERVGALVNPVSGDGRGRELAAELRACLDDRVALDARVTPGPGAVPQTVSELTDGDPDLDLLVVVGGDGTLSEVADALVGADAPPLFVVPAGRGNSVYRHLYGRADWRALVRRLSRDLEARPVDLGRYDAGPAGAGHFLLGFGGGLFRAAVEGAESFGSLPGPVAYVLGTGRALLGSDPVPVRLETGGREVFDGPARLVAVGGGRYRGNAFELLPDSRPADGQLHALVVEATGVREAVRIARAATTGRHVEHPAVNYVRAGTFDLSAPEGLPVEVDGTVLDAPIREAHLEVVPGAVRFAYPRGFTLDG